MHLTKRATYQMAHQKIIPNQLQQEAMHYCIEVMPKLLQNLQYLKGRTICWDLEAWLIIITSKAIAGMYRLCVRLGKVWSWCAISYITRLLTP